MDTGPHPEVMPLPGAIPYPDTFAERYRRAGLWIGQTHADLLFGSVGRFPERLAIVSGQTELNYRQLGDLVLRAASGLQSIGIRRGDRVVVHLPNLSEFVVLVFALFELGAVPVFALAAHREVEIRHLVSGSGARCYITVDRHEGADLADLAERLRTEMDSVEHTIVVAAGGGGSDMDALLAGEPLQHRRRCHPGDIAFLQLSGGTTGRPKLIPRTHDDYLYSVRESARICELDQETVQLVVLPISHNFSMSSPGILGVLASGASMVLSPDPSPRAAFALIERHRVSQVSLVPPLALAWLNSPIRDHYDLASLKVVQVGGAKLLPAVAQRIQPELGARLQQVFGMAEGLVNYTRLADDDELVLTTQGRPISDYDEIRVVDEQDREVPFGTPGRLLTRGPYTIRGYFRAPEHNARSFTADGFYRTGDIVQRDGRGYLTVLGRDKDQVNRGGEKIAPAEVEELLIGHPAIHDASLVGVGDEVLGERTKVYLILREEHPGDPPTGADIRRYLRGLGLAGYKIPDLVEFVARFPHTGVGKVSKREQRQGG